MSDPHVTGSRAAEPEWAADRCSFCGETQDGIEVEYCDSGEHCELCCPNWDTCEDE